MPTDGPAISAEFKPLRVGDGHGFVVEGQHDGRFVLTAAHCLPHLPQAGTRWDLRERTYLRLLAPWGAAECSAWTECLFADPVADIAVLGSPDIQELWKEAEVYEALIEDAIALRLSDPPTQYDQLPPLGGGEYTGPPVPVFSKCPAWLYSLAGRWFPCTVRHNGGRLSITNGAEDIVGGMSGTPIVVDDGSAIGILCSADGSDSLGYRQSAANPRLAENLPAWLLRVVFSELFADHRHRWLGL